VTDSADELETWHAGTALSLTLRYSRTTEGPHYLGSVAVIYTEAIKLVICLGVQLLHCRRAPKLHGNGEGWRAEFIAQSRDILLHSLPMALPAALFVMQQVSLGQRMNRNKLKMTLLRICVQHGDNSCRGFMCANERRCEESDPCGGRRTPDNFSRAWLTTPPFP